MHDPALRAQIQVRYEAGERETLLTELGVALSTLYSWAGIYGWSVERIDRAARRAQVLALRAAGQTVQAIAVALGISNKTVRNILASAREAARPVIVYSEPAPDAPPDSGPARPPGQLGGWHCSSCC